MIHRTLDELNGRIRDVRNLIASYSLLVSEHEDRARYAKRQLDHYDHELDILLSQAKREL